MKRLQLIRISQSPDCTQGVLRDEETKLAIMLTMELPWRNNEPRVSCIPAGVYTVRPYSSEKYPDVFEVVDVPSRTDILIHVGNTTNDSKGCILPGKYFGEPNGLPAVLASGESLKRLKMFIGDGEWELIVSDWGSGESGKCFDVITDKFGFFKNSLTTRSKK